MWYQEEAVDVIQELGSSTEAGLSSEEAVARLEKHGPNELSHEEKASPLKLFFDQFKNVLIIILLIATVLSLLVGETVDAIIIAVIVFFSAVLGFVQEYRAEKALDALKQMLSATITVLRDGKEQTIDARDVVPGDIMLLEAGDKVPADARMVESHSLRCDEAPLTGESLPVGKSTERIESDAPVGDRKNMVFTGSVVTYGKGRAVVTGTGMETEFGKIAREVAAVKTEKTPLEVRTEEIGKWLGIIALGICGLVIGISIFREYLQGSLNTQSGIEMVMFGVALAVAAVPEALAAIVTGALAIGMNEMAKQNALVRKMPAVETLGCTTVICTDKTGTLTRGEMTVRRIFTAGQFVDVSGAGYEPVGEFADIANARKPLEATLRCGVLCNDSTLFQKDSTWAIKGDPTEAAMVVAAEKYGIRYKELRENARRTDEVPFSSERKRMSTLHPDTEKDGKVLYVKGAPDVLLGRLSRVMDADGNIRDISDDDLEAIRRANEEMAQGALRVLAFASREAVEEQSLEDQEKDLVFLGLMGMMDPPRPEAMDAVAVCRRVHMKPVMITGDHKLTALAIAKEMDIWREGDVALTGTELEEMSQEEFDGIVDKVSVYARVSPMDKLKIVNAWKHRGEIVAMTGDGVNDAPALKHADIGIAMGVSGTEVAKEAADMVLNDDNFATIVSAIERGRWIYDNIKKYLTFLLRCNITEVLVIGGVVLVMGPEHLPLLPAAILYVNLATDGLPALALGVAPPDPDIMDRPPRNPRESVFSREVITFIMMAVVVELPVFLWMYFSSLPDVELSRTRMFFMFVLVELAIAINFRSMRYSILKSPPHKWLVLALVWEIALLVVLVQIPTIRESFGIGLPGGADLAEIAGFGLLVFMAMEAVKYIMRRTSSPSSRSVN